MSEPKHKVVYIARQCHQANKSYCESIGDYTQKDWEQAEQWQRDSAIKGVEFSLETAYNTPEQQHKKWMEDKIKDGWEYGPIKGQSIATGKKTHPCLVEYELLPEEQKLKDTLFQAIVNTFRYI